MSVSQQSAPIHADRRTYVCYDLRAIQTYIFRVPKLKYIVGGSALVDRFDRDFAANIARQFEDGVCQHVFSAGGKGTFDCRDAASANQVERCLCKEAHRLGLDIRFGRNSDFCEAAHSADKLYSFVPELVEGHPCEASGLYPVAPSQGQQNQLRGIHPTVQKRVVDRGDPVFRHFENRLLSAKPDVGPGLAGRPICFLSNIEQSERDGRAGACALEKKRWAVICMDGNDIGSQFRTAAKLPGGVPPSWIKNMSASLDKCAAAAGIKGIERVVRLWSEGMSNAEVDACVCDGEVVVPIRPLVVGGDDLVVLCHPAYAFDFIEAACAAWEAKSIEEAKQYGTRDGLTLWPATNGKLTISAGVLFCPVAMPIHTAVPYGESLLASAKSGGRTKQEPGACHPSPSMIDWETVVESILDTPAARRARELRFRDLDVPDGERGSIIELTMRPYPLSQFAELKAEAEDPRNGLARIPRSVRGEMLASLRQGKSDRSLFRKRIAKNHQVLCDWLDETPGAARSKWKTTGEVGVLRTSLPDALSLLDEISRHATEASDD